MSEHSEQSAVIDWARKLENLYPELGMLFAVPNGAKLPYVKDPKSGRRYSPEAFKLRAEGLRKGVPDLCLPVARQGFCGMFVEMKVGDNKPSPEQVAYLDALAGHNYYAAVCWGADDAISSIAEYLGLPPDTIPWGVRR